MEVLHLNDGKCRSDDGGIFGCSRSAVVCSCKYTSSFLFEKTDVLGHSKFDLRFSTGNLKYLPVFGEVVV